jgi:hypothetical protein
LGKGLLRSLFICSNFFIWRPYSYMQPPTHA